MKKKIIIIIIGITLSAIVYAIVYSIYTGYKLQAGSSNIQGVLDMNGIPTDDGLTKTQITNFDITKSVINNSSTKDIFIPTKTEAEYTSWYNHTPTNYTIITPPVCGTDTNTCTQGDVTNTTSVYDYNCGSNNCSSTSISRIDSWDCYSDKNSESCQNIVCLYDDKCDDDSGCSDDDSECLEQL